MERGGEATVLGHYTEGVLQGKEVTKRVEECRLGSRRLPSAVKQAVRLRSGAGGSVPCRGDAAQGAAREAPRGWQR